MYNKGYPGKRSPKKWSPGKKSMDKKSPEKWYLGIKVPGKNGLKKLFSVKRMLVNLNNFFIFIDWFHYTHKNMFDVHLTILHAPNCRTLKESRNVCCRVLGFHRLITSKNSTHTHTHTPRCSTLTPRFFIFDSWVCFRVLGLLSSFGLS